VRPLFALAVSPRDDGFVLLLCLVGSGGSDISKVNVDQSHGSDNVNDTLGQAEAQTRARFLTIVEISMI
jgi:hypothetical protein